MQVTNATWQLVGATNPTSLVVQNVGTCRIAYVLAASQPAVDAIELDSDEHFILAPGSPVVTVRELDTQSKSMYARALGPINGSLSVDSTT